MGFLWHWRILQGGLSVAGGSAPDRSAMLREMSRYAVQYAQEGAICCQTRTGKNRWRDHRP